MLYDNPACSNSYHWENLRHIQHILLLCVFIAAITTIILYIVYLSKKRNNKEYKGIFRFLIISLVCTILFLIGGIGLGYYISDKTKDLGYCWSSK